MTGLDKEQIDEWLEKETWFEFAEALEYGFVDEIVEAVPVENVFDLSGYKNTPESLKTLPTNENVPVRNEI